MNPVLIYITVSNREEAIYISHELLQKKLISCANIVDNVTSIYNWQGEIQTSKEAILMVKTFASHSVRAINVIKTSHSYQCPAIVTLPINDGNHEYIEWMRKQLTNELSL